MIVYIDKPRGITSFDCIRYLRRHGCVESGPDAKMGHAGTLDPLATGLLVLGVGADGTKEISRWVKAPKTYEVDVCFGVATDTGDMDGRVIKEASVTVSDDDIRQACESLRGVNELPVPRYSAVKVKGKPLYRYAREGVSIDPPVRSMAVTHSTVLAIGRRDERAYVSCVLDVASGVYIRSLAEEAGRRCGVPATVSALRRTRVGTAHIRDALSLEEAARLVCSRKTGGVQEIKNNT